MLIKGQTVYIDENTGSRRESLHANLVALVLRCDV